MEGLTVKDLSLALDDMYEGMVLTTMAGYPLTVQLDPFRVNNVSMSIQDTNLHYKNGIIHKFSEYPIPIVPWFEKSSMQVLIETNIHRNGDLSGFIALLQAIPSLYAKLQLQEEGTNTATTLFVPTNNALLSFDPSLVATNQDQGLNTTTTTTTMQLIQNHFVSGNFARKCWQTIPTGTKVSNTTLRLKSDAGQDLDLVINDSTVIIIGYSTIVQGDVFTHDGILQIIDKVLVLV